MLILTNVPNMTFFAQPSPLGKLNKFKQGHLVLYNDFDSDYKTLLDQSSKCTM